MIIMIESILFWVQWLLVYFLYVIILFIWLLRWLFLGGLVRWIITWHFLCKCSFLYFGRFFLSRVTFVCFSLVSPLLNSEIRTQACTGANNERISHFLVVYVLKTGKLLLDSTALLNVISKLRLNFGCNDSPGHSFQCLQISLKVLFPLLYYLKRRIYFLMDSRL